MKIMGILSLPILGKFFKKQNVAKIVKVAGSSTKMPEWFPGYDKQSYVWWHKVKKLMQI